MFQKHIEQFNESINSLRDFVNILDPFLKEKMNKHEQYVSPIIKYGILKNIIEEKTDWKDDQEKETLKRELELLKTELLGVFGESNIDFERDFSVSFTKEGLHEKEKKQHSQKISINLRFPGNNKVDEHMMNMSKMNHHISNLYKTSFISLLSSVEWFFSQILHFYYDKHPKAAGIHKKTLSLEEIKQFNSIEEAEKYLIDIKIEEILRNSFSEWISLLKTELKLGLSYVDDFEKQLIEFYQRRNLLVHNGGIVNSIYMSRVDSVLTKNIMKGDELGVDKEYLNNAISRLQIVFLLIACELWKSLDKDDKKRGEVLGIIVYENLIESNWDLCESLTYFIKNDAKLDTTDKIIAKLNYWLCKKRKGEFENIKDELEKEDFSDKKEIFQLGLYALLENKEKFFEILPITLETKHLNTERLEEFPIFKEMRDTEEYQKFKENSKFFKQASSEIIGL